MTDVAGRTAFITGGANGIGLGIARHFAKSGVKLALVDLDSEALASAKAELEGITQVKIHTLDVRDRKAYAAVADAVEAALGPVTVLVNNAGVAAGVPAAKFTYEYWDWSVGINLGGVINGIQTFLPRMITLGQGGHILNTASGAGLVPASTPLYCTPKYAVVGMSEALQPELSQYNIGVTVLCPGPVATGIVNRSADAAPSTQVLGPEAQEQTKAALAQTTAWLQQGVTIDAVGEMVLRGIQNDALYVITDRMIEPIVKARTDAMMAALPN